MMRSYHFARWAVAMLLAGALLSGCATTRSEVNDGDLVVASYTAADQLVAGAPWLLTESQPVLVASLANINALENSSAFGRIASEQLSSRLAQKGLTVIEMKMRKNVFIENDSGEFVLSRQVRDLSRAHNATAVLAGTYAVGRDTVFVNTRLIRVLDGVVLASYDYTLPIGPNTRSLLVTQ
ncbi:FlgO family outer membrane protein [Plasticicumulans acidivorans]|uniref:FlgO domain-containing protein n=1 Tax=Plasticicumulans acidivorans TaxID=886464 RepID=A0A317MZ86_9GAMM|nr:FlgO family outer membrane protein [Plasticicumulans acidivorans]PWV64668.1 hypothetical protein C7443_102319 [Plasticicumulans acidivorans]